ncbi:MAG TPA: hypothetical protein VID71_03080 [Steroidobacteraceae bacterium]|jgi:hypothetical protein
MSDKDMGHGSDQKSGGHSAKDAQSGQGGQKNKDDWRPQPPGEASGSSQEATPSPAPGEKLHGDKLQSATGARGSGGGG